MKSGAFLWAQEGKTQSCPNQKFCGIMVKVWIRILGLGPVQLGDVKRIFIKSCFTKGIYTQWKRRMEKSAGQIWKQTWKSVCFGQSNRWGNEMDPWVCAIGLPHTPLSLSFYFILPGWSGNLEAERLNHSGPSLLRCLVCSSSLWNSSLGDSSLI